MQRMETLPLSLPIAFPDVTFSPPATGIWLEVRLFPNEPENLVWDDDGIYREQGFLQVLVCYRPGKGQVAASEVADSVIQHFPKGTELGGVSVSKKPWQSPNETDGARSFIPVTIRYLGITK
jgi:hypothetical protein